MGNDRFDTAKKAAATEMATISLSRWKAVAPHLGLRLRSGGEHRDGARTNHGRSPSRDLVAGATIPLPGLADWWLETIIETEHAIVAATVELRTSWHRSPRELAAAASAAVLAHPVAVVDRVVSSSDGAELAVRAIHSDRHLAGLLLAPRALVAPPCNLGPRPPPAPRSISSEDDDNGVLLVAVIDPHLLVSVVAAGGSDLGVIGRQLLEPCRARPSTDTRLSSVVFRYHGGGRLSIVVVDRVEP